MKTLTGMSPLYYAYKLYRSKETCRMLIDLGADCSVQPENGVTLVHLAVRYKQVDVCQYLLQKGAAANLDE